MNTSNHELESSVLRKILRTLRVKFSRLICPQPSNSEFTFSQEGEDSILSRLFDHKQTPGFYVDVGAHHPTRFSNTYRFYRDGWRGINIDPLPEIMQQFNQLRPRDINIEAAIGCDLRPLTYHMFNEPALNTLDPRLAKERDGVQHYQIVERKEIIPHTLAEILTNNLPPHQTVDFLSVDVEGFDLDVLKSNDWIRFQPSYVLAEDTHAQTIHQAINCQVTSFMEGVGYEMFAKTVNTLFFRRRTSDI